MSSALDFLGLGFQASVLLLCASGFSVPLSLGLVQAGGGE